MMSTEASRVMYPCQILQDPFFNQASVPSLHEIMPVTFCCVGVIIYNTLDVCIANATESNMSHVFHYHTPEYRMPNATSETFSCHP
jgi:hypothetical protein